jgi:hypothetical protein
MTSKKSKTARLEQSQLLKAKEHIGIDTTDPNVSPPPGAMLADQQELSHNNTYGRLPRFYVDRLIVCQQCGTEEVWPAARQKWWYEVAKGHINSNAVLCLACRDTKKQRKEEAHLVHMVGLKKKHENNET